MVNWWSRYVSTGLVSATAFLVGLTLVPYVAVDTLLQGLVLIDVLAGETPDRTGRAWRLLFWNPWWVVGVLLFCAGAWLNQYILGLEE